MYTHCHHHAHPALTIQPTVLCSLSMHQELSCILTFNTTMVFLPGDHVLDQNITVANVARSIMCGKSSNSQATFVQLALNLSRPEPVFFNFYL